MCLAIPGKVISLDGRKATVVYPGHIRLAMIGEVVPKVGDYVMVQMGIVVKILTSTEAKSALKAWQEVEKN